MEKLEEAREKVLQILQLIEGNRYESYMVRQLLPVQFELERQMSLCIVGESDEEIEGLKT